jgi:ribosomal protein S18 acetylase RimI-like enzyme
LVRLKISKLKQREKTFVSVLMTESLIEEYGEPPDIRNIEDLLDYYFSRPDSMIFCLEAANTRAGFIWVIHSSDVIMGTPFCCVLYLAIKKEFRGNGYSKLLLEKAKSYCKENNIGELRLTVRYNNSTALNLYEYSGFKTYKHEMVLKLDA